ncbi:MAG: TRAP transporter large permease [Pseudomonadota bacterium]
MSDFVIACWSFPVLLLLIAAGFPIALVMFAIGMIGSWLVLGEIGPALGQLKTLIYSTFSSYTLSMIPMFLLMGQFASRSGFSRDLFRAAEAFVGHRPGGLAQATILACGGFGAICGSSLATAAAMGQVALPELNRHGYPAGFAAATLAAGGTLGILIPPSIILVIYAILAEQNIAHLFVAALGPAALAVFLYFVTARLIAVRSKNCPPLMPRRPWRARFILLGGLWPIILVFILVVGGLYAGWFTSIEAASIGAAGTGLIGLAQRRLNWVTIEQSILATAKLSGMILLMLLGASLFNFFLGLTRLPHLAAEFALSLPIAPLLLLLLLLLIYLILGCLMDSMSMILLTVPIFLPIITGLDFGLSHDATVLWFGILVLVVVEVGLITPPIGLNLFVIKGLAPGLATLDLFRAIVPFIASDLVRVALLLAFPGLSLWLVYH